MGWFFGGVVGRGWFLRFLFFIFLFSLLHQLFFFILFSFFILSFFFILFSFFIFNFIFFSSSTFLPLIVYQHFFFPKQNMNSSSGAMSRSPKSPSLFGLAEELAKKMCFFILQLHLFFFINFSFFFFSTSTFLSPEPERKVAKESGSFT